MPARFPWREVTTVKHYHLSVNALKQPMDVREGRAAYGVDVVDVDKEEAQ